MAALLNDYRASAIKEPLIQHPGNDADTKDVENGDPEPTVGTIVGADSTYPKEQESKCNVNVDVFANSVKYSSGTSDTAFINEYNINKTRWKEAAIHVSKGADADASLFHCPKGYWSKKAFKILHHPIYYVIHLIVSLLLMFLAPIETEIFHEGNKTTLLLTSSTEILLLSFFAVDIIMKFIWLGPKKYFDHRRTLLISIVLIVIATEAFTVLIRQKNHIRITKALRPVFFIDSHYLFGVRRVMRQILLCVKPITDVLLLILFFIVFFSLLGYYFFTDVDPTFYASFWRTFVSLFITMTTANNPDVMLEVIYEHPVSVIFFVAYLLITFYYLMNVLLAVVYGSYEEQEKKKFKRVFRHKIRALDKAYDILATDPDQELCFRDFLMFMHYYQPMTPKWQVMCIFKALCQDPQHQKQQYLSREEFFNLHTVKGLKWKLDHTHLYLSSKLRWAVSIHKFCNIIVKSKAFNVVINLIVLVNLLFLLIFTIITSGSASDRYTNLQKILPASYLFISIYIIEILLRIIGVGPIEHFKKKRNILDFLVILISFICLLLENKAKFVFLASIRPFKLIRVLRLKRRYRDITSTTIVLIPRLIDVVLLLMVVYYFFAIIGIECLRGVVHKGCCNSSWYGIGSSYSGAYLTNTTDNFPASSDVYYILNFNNVFNSYMTLFVLMVVNNWFIIMEGFASEVKASWLVRIYFMSFFIVMLVILQVVISFIVDEFKFKVLDTAKERVCSEHGKPFEYCRCKRNRKKVVEVSFLPADVAEIESHSLPKHRCDISFYIRKFRQIKLHQDETMKFIGRRLKTRDDIKLKIFQTETEEWTKEYMDMKLNSSKQFNPHQPHSDSDLKEHETKTDKAKRIMKRCILYFVDWVIE